MEVINDVQKDLIHAISSSSSCNTDSFQFLPRSMIHCRPRNIQTILHSNDHILIIKGLGKIPGCRSRSCCLSQFLYTPSLPSPRPNCSSTSSSRLSLPPGIFHGLDYSYSWSGCPTRSQTTLKHQPLWQWVAQRGH